MTHTPRILMWLVFATALATGGCYVEAEPAAPVGVVYAPAPAPPPPYGRAYVWHSYYRPAPPR